MNTNHKNSEDEPRNFNPEEFGKKHPAKETKSQEKIDIKESDLGRSQSQTPADEHIGQNFSQIDSETADLQTQHNGLRDEINDTDERDHGDSTRDWDAENSRTGRNK